ncbi:hypothetical protein Vi05172_g1904 [Venturia inaequalis]|nr:hypothetical protein Vi05172_g1904 [Venturia inaequalis]
MPKSKRAKVVHLTQVDKKDKAHRQKIFADVQEAASAFPYIYVFSIENMRNSCLKEVRTEFSDSRLFFSKTKIMAKALGLDAASEHLPGLSTLTPYLKGEAGILCTPRSPSEVQSFFSTYTHTDFPRSNNVAAYTFTIPKGIVYSRGGEIPAEEDMKVAHSVEPQLRKCGMPTRLDKGTVMLDADYTVCEEGKTLNSHQTALLKAFGVAMAEFKVTTLAYWHSETGEVKKCEEEEMETDL